MHHFFVSPGQISEGKVRLEGQDARHILQVLRMRPGEEFIVRTGEDGITYRCCLDGPEEDGAAVATVMWTEEDNTELPSRIVLFQCLPKSDKMEWIIQKAVELGAAGIVPVQSARSIVRLDGSRAANKVKRWNAISESAAKQSRRAFVPAVEDIMSFQAAVAMAAESDVFLFPYELADDMGQTRQILAGLEPGRSVSIMIGPEGGFAPEEAAAAMEAGARCITLGRRILRTETAGMALLSALMIRLEGRTDAGDLL